MKKLFLITTALCLSAGIANAQYYDNQGYNRGYDQQRYGSQQTYNRSGSNRSAQPARRSSSGSYQRSNRRSSVDRSYSRSSKRSRSGKRGVDRNGKKFYVTPRLGYGATTGWHTYGNSNVDNATAPIFPSIAAGMYLKDFRVEGEFSYHWSDEIYSDRWGNKIEYSQYDFGVNGYYDFNLGKFKPFVGAGAGLSKTKLTYKGGWGWYDDSYSKTGFALSAIGGCSYELNDFIALEAMGRFRYLFRDGHLYNYEALGGARFSF